MGAVYLARHERLGREAALKVVSRRLTASGEATFQQKFHEEGGLMASLEHDHIVRVFDAGESNGRYYLAMEYLAGGDLEEKKRQSGGRLAPAVVAEYMRQLLEALVYAHDKDVVHRDLKPANLLLSGKGTIKVGDFGLARVMGDTFEQSVIERSQLASRVGDARTRVGTGGTGDRSGTLYYMAPEVLKGNPADARSDLYAVGVIGYYLLTGDKPIGAYKAASAAVKGLDRGWDKWLNGLLQSDPEERTSSASDALRDLSRLRRKSRRQSVSAKQAKTSRITAGVLAGVAALLAVYLALPEETGVFRAEIENPGLVGDDRLEISVDRRQGRSTPRVIGRLASIESAERLRTRLRRPFPARDATSVDGVLQKEVPAGTQWIEVRHPYYESQTLELAMPSRGMETETLELTRGLAWVEFRFDLEEAEQELLRTEGGPRVRVNGHPISVSWQEEVLQLSTFPAGRGEIDFDHPFFEPERITYDIDAYGSQVAVLEPVRSAGTVDLVLEPSDTVWRIEADDSAVADGMGSAEVELPAGLYRFVASRRGYEAEPRPLVLRRGHDLRLEEALFGELAVEFGNERLWDDERLQIKLEGEAVVYEWDGRVLRMNGIAAGENELVVTHPDYKTLARAVEVTPGTVTDYALEMERSEGRLEISVKPEELEWSLWRPDGEIEEIEGSGDWAGDLPTGEYVFVGHLDGYQPVSAEIMIDLDETVPLVLEAARSAGAIDIEVTNIPAGHEEPTVIRVDGEEWRHSFFDGVFRLVGVAAGEREVKVKHPSAGIKVARPAVTHEETTSMEVALEPWKSRLIDTPELAVEHGAPVIALAWAPNGRYLATCGEDGAVRLWNILNQSEVLRLERHEGSVSSVAFSSDGNRLLTGGEDGTVRVWEIPSGELRRELDWAGGGVTSVAFSPGGEELALAGGERGILRLWRVSDGEVLIDLSGHEGAVNSIAFSPCGEIALSGAHDRTARLWRLETGEELAPAFEHRRLGVNAVAFSADGKHALTGVNDNTARLWNVDMRQELRVFLGHDNSVLSVDFSADGSSVLTSGGWDGTARVWDAAMGWELYRIETNDRVFCAAFSPQNRRMLATGGAEGRAAVWLLE